MNTSKLLFLVICLVALTLTAPLVTAAPRGGSGFSGGHHFASMPARGGQTFTRSGAGNFRTFNDRRFVNNRFVNNRFVNNRFVNNRIVNHRFVNNRSSVVFIGDFGFPWWWGWGPSWGWGEHCQSSSIRILHESRLAQDSQNQSGRNTDWRSKHEGRLHGQINMGHRRLLADSSPRDRQFPPQR